ncbi:MAG TPA: protein-disulfide reductase DsbD domain-containing protein [Micropepsaceae bacterium]|nr:protein-disulfide reductase DsbD domain-containing protein [Micropepsaceae bacterium]
MKRLLVPCLALICAALICRDAAAQSGALPDDKPKVDTSLVPERAGVAPGGTVTVALNEIIRKKWHTYWINPGDAGAPTTINWHLPPGWSAGAIQWPYPKHLPVGPLMDFGYEDQVALLSDIKAPADAKPGDRANLSADVMLLVCAEVCVPEEKHLTLPMSVTASPPPSNAKTASLFAEARAKLPHASPWSAIYDADDKRFALLIQSPELVTAKPRATEFYPYTDGMVEPAAAQSVGTSDQGLVIESRTGHTLANKDKRAGIGKLAGLLVLTGADGRVDALNIEAEPGLVPVSSVTLEAGASGDGLPQLLLFAFLGGLILNLMPCVFPVLSMKALALASNRDAPGKARAAAFAYGTGAVLSFLVLAGALLGFRAAGMSLGWGFQLQQPLFVTALALLMFAVGLNLSGLYEFGGARVANLGGGLARKEGASGSFFTGVLAVVVATPCTAPFMGAAMGYALTANADEALAIFAALGLGFAAPFVLVGLVPGALRLLPRPGAWMTTLRQMLAFPMYGAAVWLVWVLSLQTGSDGVLAALAAALLLSFALWVYGRSQGTSGLRRAAGLVAAALALLGTGILIPRAGAGTPPASAATPSQSALGYEPFSAARLQALRAEGRPVFINATAAWCITCLVNEKVALSGTKLARAFADQKVAALKADWTNQDSEITALLASHGRSGVPLYLYFGPGAEAPIILPQLLTESTVLAALNSTRSAELR